MKKLFTFAFIWLTIISCTNNQEPDFLNDNLDVKPLLQNYDQIICYDWYSVNTGAYITTTGNCTPVPGEVPPAGSHDGSAVGIIHPSNGAANYVYSPDAPPADLAYSGDKLDIPDQQNDNPCPGSGSRQRIPDWIQTLPDGSGVNIRFGFTTSDGLSADQYVTSTLIDALTAALTRVNTPAPGKTVAEPITTIYIKATINGSHASNSNHYKGLAVDISRINGSYVSSIGGRGTVSTLQAAFNRVRNSRENFGPAQQTKLGAAYKVGGHDDHIHFSVNCL